MLITYFRSKALSIAAASCLVAACSANSASALPWFEARDGEVVLKAQSGVNKIIKVPAEVRGVFFDGNLHYVGVHGYFSVFQIVDSNPGNPEGFCGSGSEVWLQLVRSNGMLSSRILVSSCLKSFSLASQNTGLRGQDSDFSSIEWNGDGFSIKWFDRKDRCGRSLNSVFYKECGKLFCALKVVD